MARLSADQRRGLKTSQFGLPSKAKSAKGKATPGSYPMPDRSHAIAAKAFAARHASPAQKAQIDRRANKVLGKSGSKSGSKSSSKGSSKRGR